MRREGGNSKGGKIFDSADELLVPCEAAEDGGVDDADEDDAEAKGLNVELIRSHTRVEIIDGSPVVIDCDD